MSEHRGISLPWFYYCDVNELNCSKVGYCFVLFLWWKMHVAILRRGSSCNLAGLVMQMRYEIFSKIFYWPMRYFFYESFVLLCPVFVMLLRLFINALWSHEGKGLTSWLLFVMCFFVILLLSHLVSWDRCGTCLYRFLILAAFLSICLIMTYCLPSEIVCHIKGELIKQVRIIVDWLQSLKHFFINVSYHILVASLTLMALFSA